MKFTLSKAGFSKSPRCFIRFKQSMLSYVNQTKSEEYFHRCFNHPTANTDRPYHRQLDKSNMENMLSGSVFAMPT